MSLKDVSEMMVIEKDVFFEPWDEQTFNECASNHESYVMLHKEELIGYLISIVQGDIGYIANFAIKKSWQQKGLGWKFLVYLILKAKKRSLMALYLDVRESNEAAIKLYERVGFSIYQRVEKYYQTPPEDSLQMILILRKHEKI
jgi:[ribosomal protein S18]-alanine N-acetyltransferase